MNSKRPHDRTAASCHWCGSQALPGHPLDQVYSYVEVVAGSVPAEQYLSDADLYHPACVPHFGHYAVAHPSEAQCGQRNGSLICVHVPHGSAPHLFEEAVRAPSAPLRRTR